MINDYITPNRTPLRRLMGYRLFASQQFLRGIRIIIIVSYNSPSVCTKKKIHTFFKRKPLTTGADLGEGGGGGGRGQTPFTQGFDPVPTQRVPPLILFKKSIFGQPTLKIFKRRLWRQYILTLRSSARQKNAIFGQNFSKSAQTRLFSKICLRRRKFCQNRGKTVLWESSKNQFGRPKKSSKFKKILFFENPPPLRKS